MAKLAFIDQTANRLWETHDHGRDAVSLNVAGMLRYMAELHGQAPIRDGANWFLAEHHLLANRVVDDETGCWIFGSGVSRQTGTDNPTRPNRHLVIWFPSLRRQEAPHRMAARLWLGLDGNDRSVVVRHRCDRPHCFNPDHLELGSQADNVRDMIERGRAQMQGQARLTRDQVREIKTLLRSGMTRTAIAPRFGVSIATISDISRGITWRSVSIEG